MALDAIFVVPPSELPQPEKVGQPPGAKSPDGGDGRNPRRVLCVGSKTWRHCGMQGPLGASDSGGSVVTREGEAAEMVFGKLVVSQASRSPCKLVVPLASHRGLP